jgi:hypothetical protein
MRPASDEFDLQKCGPKRGTVQELAWLEERAYRLHVTGNLVTRWGKYLHISVQFLLMSSVCRYTLNLVIMASKVYLNALFVNAG